MEKKYATERNILQVFQLIFFWRKKCSIRVDSSANSNPVQIKPIFQFRFVILFSFINLSAGLRQQEITIPNINY